MHARAPYEEECMLFGGTAVVQGSCVAVVTDIGMTTEMGKIQAGPPMHATRSLKSMRLDRGSHAFLTGGERL